MATASGKVLGRMTASQINAMKPDPREFSLNASGQNTAIPLCYGRRVVPGIRVTTVDAGSYLYCLVVWCLGEVRSIESVFINGDAPATGVELRNYRGTTYQGVDSWLEAEVTDYEDDLILRKPSGDIGVCYTVAKIPASYDQQPRFQAIIDGKLVFDPDSSSSGDPFFDNVGLSIHFIGTNGQTSATDDSPAAHTVTFNGTAEIQSNELDPGTAGVTVTNSAALEFGTEAWTIEIKATSAVVSGTGALIWKGTGGALGFHIYRLGTGLVFSASSNGTTYDIASNVVVSAACFTAATPVTIIAEYSGREYVFYVDGVEEYRLVSSATIFDNSEDWNIAVNATGGSVWDGSVQSMRATFGYARYSSPVPVNAAGNAFDDLDSYVPGYVYSDNTALIFADAATSPVYGAGTTVLGLSECKAWDDSDVSPAIPRSRVGIILATPKKTKQTLDLLATYGELLYTYEGSKIRMTPDKMVGQSNPSGPELISTATPEPFDENIATDEGGIFVVTLVIDSRSAGGIDVEIDGDVVIAAATANEAGTFTAQFTATSDSTQVEVIGDGSWSGTVGSISVRRLYALQNQWIGSPPSIDPVESTDTPTKATISYTVPVEDSPNWPSASASYTLPDAAAGLVPLIETAISLPGVYQPAEAAYKALARVLRMVNRSRVSGVVPDRGLSLTPGTVIQAVSEPEGIDVLVQLDSWEMVDGGRYRISGMRYDTSYYPSEIPSPEDTGTVPVGAILMLKPASSVPAGWSVYSAADGKYIMVGVDPLDTDFEVGDTGGSNTHSGFSGDVYEGGAHGDSANPVYARGYLPSPTGSGSGWRYNDDVDEITSGEHDHTYSIGTITQDAYRRENVLIQKTGTAGALIPKEAMVFGFDLAHALLSRSTAFQGRLLMAEADGLDAGANVQWDLGTTGSTSFSHDHYDRTLVTDGYEFESVHPAVNVTTGGPSHAHSLLTAINILPKKYTMALYAGSDDYPVLPGTVFLWSGAMDTLPTDFYLLDGSDGRPDLHKHFIEIAGVGDEGASSGSNKIQVQSYTYPAGAHDHETGTPSSPPHPATVNVPHSNSRLHSHNDISGLSVDETDDYTLPYYVLAAIVYDP